MKYILGQIYGWLGALGLLAFIIFLIWVAIYMVLNGPMG